MLVWSVSFYEQRRSNSVEPMTMPFLPFLLSFIEIVLSRTYYLSHTGTSSNECLLDSPCLAWEDVTTSGLMQDGDTLIIDADTTINIDKIWNIPGIVHINGTSNLTSTLFFNGSADMSTTSGLIDCESNTPNLEIYMDNLHFVEDQEYIYIRGFKLEGWLNGTFSLTNTIVDDVYSAASMELIRIIGYTESYPQDTSYVNSILIENVLFRSSFTNFGNAKLIYVRFAKYFEMKNVKVQGGEFYYFAYLNSITNCIIDGVEFNNITSSYELFAAEGSASSDNISFKFDNITVTNNSFVAANVISSELNNQTLVTNFLFEDSTSDGSFVIQFQDASTTSMDNIRFNNAKVNGRAISLHDVDYVDIARLSIGDSTFSGSGTIDETVFIDDAITCVIDDIWMKGNIFNDNVFFLQGETSLTMSNLVFINNSWQGQIIQLYDVASFTLSHSYFSDVNDNATKSPVLRILSSTTSTLTDINVSNINANSMTSSIEFYCNGTNAISIFGMSMLNVTVLENVMEMKNCINAFTINQLNISDSSAESGLFIGNGYGVTITDVVFSQNSFTVADILCQDCYNCDFDSLTLIDGISQTNTLLFQTANETEIDDHDGVTIENSFIIGYSNYDSLGYFINDNLNKNVEYIFQNVEFINNQYVGDDNDKNVGLITVSGINVTISFIAVTWIDNIGFDSVIFCESGSICQIIIDESRFENNTMNLGMNAIWLEEGAFSSITVKGSEFRPNTNESQVENFYNDSIIVFIDCDFAPFTFPPTNLPSIIPSYQPSNIPSSIPSHHPSGQPTNQPTTIKTTSYVSPITTRKNMTVSSSTDMFTPTQVNSNNSAHGFDIFGINILWFIIAGVSALFVAVITILCVIIAAKNNTVCNICTCTCCVKTQDINPRSGHNTEDVMEEIVGVYSENQGNHGKTVNVSNPNNVEMVHISMPAAMGMPVSLPVAPSMGQTLEKKQQGEADISYSNTYTADSGDESHDGIRETTGKGDIGMKPAIENINLQEGNMYT